MHEMSLAMSVEEIASRTIDSHPGASLTAVEITVGELAGVELDSFRTALDAVFRSSRWPDAVAELNIVAARARCVDCGHEFHPDAIFASCPACGSGACALTAGTEFRVSAIRLHTPDE